VTSANEAWSSFADSVETDTIPIDNSLPAGIATGLMVSFGSPLGAALPSIC
jgi:hypothetical protein